VLTAELEPAPHLLFESLASLVEAHADALSQAAARFAAARKMHRVKDGTQIIDELGDDRPRRQYHPSPAPERRLVRLAQLLEDAAQPSVFRGGVELKPAGFRACRFGTRRHAAPPLQRARAPAAVQP
jgi:hypothetical protein